MKKEIKHQKCPYCGRFSPSYLYQSHIKQCKETKSDRWERSESYNSEIFADYRGNR